MPTPPSFTQEDVDFVKSNIGILSYPQIAEKRGLSLSCVKRIGKKVKSEKSKRSNKPNRSNRSEPSEPNQTALSWEPKTIPESQTLDPILSQEDLAYNYENEPIQSEPSEPIRSINYNSPLTITEDQLLIQIENDNSFQAEDLRERLKIKGAWGRANKNRYFTIIRNTLFLCNKILKKMETTK